MIEFWFDGAVEPVNPGGWGGYGAAIYRDGEKLHEISGLIQKAPSGRGGPVVLRARSSVHLPEVRHDPAVDPERQLLRPGVHRSRRRGNSRADAAVPESTPRTQSFLEQKDRTGAGDFTQETETAC